jgi:hypothetical protein
MLLFGRQPHATEWHSKSSVRNPGGSQGLVQGAAVDSIWSGERVRKKEWISPHRQPEA